MLLAVLLSTLALCAAAHSAAEQEQLETLEALYQFALEIRQGSVSRPHPA